jgi:hypothetical protein
MPPTPVVPPIYPLVSPIIANGDQWDIIRNGLMLEYRFDEYYKGGGTKIYDFSGFNNFGTKGAAGAAPTWAPTGLSFDGGDLTTTTGIQAQIGATQPLGTVTIVFYTASALNKDSPAQNLISFIDGASQRYMALGSVTGSLANEIITWVDAVAGSRSGWCDASATIGIGWHNFTMYWDGTKYVAILDNVIKTMSTSGTNVQINISDTINLADLVTGNYYTGIFAYCLIYNRTLQPIENTHNYKYLNNLLKTTRGITPPL